MCPSGNQSQERAPGEFNLVPSGPKQRAERKKVPALAQARTVDLILNAGFGRRSKNARKETRVSLQIWPLHATWLNSNKGT
jgi:hypothetical protein